jgi:hypothetical protein
MNHGMDLGIESFTLKILQVMVGGCSKGIGDCRAIGNKFLIL